MNMEIVVTQQESIASTTWQNTRVSIPKFIKGMEKMHNNLAFRKEDLASFNLVEFADPSSKKEHTIISIHGQILDFDGCICDVQEVLNFFKDYTYVAYSSFNNGKKGEGLRFRLVIPYNTPITGIDYTKQKTIYEHIFDLFAQQMAKLPTGLDTSKRNPGAFYIRPCMTDHPLFFTNEAELFNWREFIETDASRELMHKKIEQQKKEEAETHLRRQVSEERALTMTPEMKTVAAARSLQKFAYAGSGTGNIMFFKYAKSLAGKGFDTFEIKQLLEQNAHAFGNVHERKSEIKHILKSI